MIEALKNPTEFYKRSVPEAPEAVRLFYTALTAQDRDLLLSCLASDFTFKSPLAESNTPEEYADLVGNFAGWVETDGFVMEGNKTVHFFTFHMIEPGEAEIPVCEVFTLRGGKVKSLRAYNDSADFLKMKES